MADSRELPPSPLPDFDADAIARDARAHGLVVIAGAGVSMGPPSSLPNWTAINDAFIELLALTIARHTKGEVGYDVAEFVASRRDDAGVAAPDLQAQFAEESLGDAYYRLFQPLDIDAWNDSHAALGAIARSGVLRAVITTNFDRLIEFALTADEIAHTVFCSPEEFEQLAKAASTHALPIVKVHGSVERRDTIVDTLRQRVLGRPAALESALAPLLARHAVLVAGFSGADLAYDPHYLGLRAAAQASPAFSVLNEKGRRPRPEISALAASAARMSIADGTLPHSLRDLARALGGRRRLSRPRWDIEMSVPGARRAALPSDVMIAAADSISPVQATVVLASIADAAGSSDAAYHLLTRTMPHHSKAGLLGDPAMPRQQRMIAAELIEAARVHPQLLAEPGLTALEVLSLAGVHLDSVGLALRALAFALCGDGHRSDPEGLQALRASRNDFHPARRADTICVLARGWTVFERWIEPHREALREEYERMFHYGDEPRRIRVGALYGRFLVEAGEIELAAKILRDCEAASARLKLPLVHNDLVVVGGRLALAQKRYAEAARTLRSVYGHFERSRQTLRCAETLLPLREAAAMAGDGALAAHGKAVLERIVEMLPGLALGDAASQVRTCLDLGAVEAARGVVTELRALGERWHDNVWIGVLADQLDIRIGSRNLG